MSNILPIIFLLLILFASVLLKQKIIYIVLLVSSLGITLFNLRYGLNLLVVVGLLGTWIGSILYFKTKGKVERFDNSQLEIKEAYDSLEIKNEQNRKLLEKLDLDLYKIISEYSNKNTLDDIVIYLNNQEITNVFQLSLLITNQSENHTIYDMLDKNSIINAMILYKLPNLYDIDLLIELNNKYINLETLSNSYKRRQILGNNDLLSMSIEYFLKQRPIRPHYTLLLEDLILPNLDIDVTVSEVLSYDLSSDNEYCKDLFSILVIFENIGFIKNDNLNETVTDLRDIDYLTYTLNRISRDNLEYLHQNELIRKYNIVKSIELYLKIDSINIKEVNEQVDNISEKETYKNNLVDIQNDDKISLTNMESLSVEKALPIFINEILELIKEIRVNCEKYDPMNRLVNYYLLFMKGLIRIISQPQLKQPLGKVFLVIAFIAILFNI